MFLPKLVSLSVLKLVMYRPLYGERNVIFGFHRTYKLQHLYIHSGFQFAILP
jgi:hypothetical protein